MSLSMSGSAAGSKTCFSASCKGVYSYVISYVARIPPFCRGRRGLTACACARTHA